MQRHRGDYEDTQQTSESLPLRLLDLASMVEKAWSEALAPYMLTPPEFRVLVIIADRRQCTATEIGVLAPVDPSSISRVVQRLVKRGLVARRRSQSDRRIVSLRATPSGLEIVQQLAQPLLDFTLTLMGDMPDIELRSFTAGIDRMHAHLLDS